MSTQQENKGRRSLQLMQLLCAIVVGMLLGMTLKITAWPWEEEMDDKDVATTTTDSSKPPAINDTSNIALPSVSTAVEWSKLQQGKAAEETVVLEVEVPERQQGGQVPHLAQDLIVVLDTSGSMSGSRLAHAKTAICDLIDRLEGKQTLHLIRYSWSASIVFQTGTAKEASQLKHSVRQMVADGLTNMGDGLRLAQEIANEIRHHSLRRVFVFSDGHVNQGMRGQELLDLVQAMGKKGLPTTAFGIGQAYEFEVMTGLAEAGNGEFFHVDSAAAIEQSLAVVSRAFHKVFASDVRLELTMPEGISLRSVFGAQKDIGSDFSSPGTATLPLKDLRGGEKRLLSVILDVQNHFAEEIGTKILMAYRISFDDMGVGQERRSVEGKLNVAIVQELGADDMPNLEAKHAKQLHEAVRREGEVVRKAIMHDIDMVSAEFEAEEKDAHDAMSSYARECQDELGNGNFICGRLVKMQLRKFQNVVSLESRDLTIQRYKANAQLNSVMDVLYDEL